MPLHILSPFVFLLLLYGCAAQPSLSFPPIEPEPASLTPAQCRQYLQAIDETVRRHHNQDAQDYAIPGLPFLRTNRILSTYASAGLTPEQSRYWLNRLQQRDLEARALELRNLDAVRWEPVFAHYERCSRQVLQAEPPRLPTRIEVPDDYQDSKRVLGLYPLTSLFVKQRIRRLQADTRSTFARPLDELELKGTLVHYAPAAAFLSQAEFNTLLARSRDNPLRIPIPPPEDLNRLFDHYAPVWAVDTLDDNDHIGKVVLDATGRAHVDPKIPVVYRHYDLTQFHGKTLLQLNYTLWFPSRPSAGAFDIYSGKLDGITFRLTLNEDGEPLLADSMHNCGCYHQFYPTGALAPNQAAIEREPEPPLIVQTLPAWTHGARYMLRIASGNHYIQRILSIDAPTLAGTVYTPLDYNELRSLPLPSGGYGSMFDETGLVPGTERAERWLLWPLGVPSPGAMRQKGRHAIAFVGKRHFDDPDLIARFFTIKHVPLK
ncbi:MAG: hypothetical protein AB1810_04425 [Pseudomonadota bacterium]